MMYTQMPSLPPMPVGEQLPLERISPRPSLRPAEEAAPLEALAESIRGRTQIVITQRVTSAMHSDCIYVMDKGSLVDSGTHEELLGRCGVYQEIYASQTGGVPNEER